jgi:hypothetical protein
VIPFSGFFRFYIEAEKIGSGSYQQGKIKAMINTLKYLFLLVLCVGLIGGAQNVSAQTGEKVLLSTGGKQLKQSDVNKMIEFYEWVFEAKFSADERARFAEYTAREFRANPANARKTIDDIVGVLPKFQAASEDVQAKTRKDFLDVFLSEARKNTDENSQMLIGIYEAAHGGNDSDAAENKANENAPVNNADEGVGNISAIVGNWVWGSSGSSTYSSGGSYIGSNGSRHTYQFNPNGTVEYTGIMNVMTAGCRMQVFRSAKGRASLSGNTLTINWSPAAFSRADSCSPSKDYKKTLPAETETFQVKFKTDYGQRQLCMTGKDETCYSPEK